MLAANYVLLAFLGCFLIFTWQHVARKQKWTWKPSYILDLITNQLVKVWNFLGKVCVWISSFYTWIDPSDLLATLNELFTSVYHFLFSWKAFIESYVSNMNLYDHPYLVSCGTATLVALLSYIVWFNYAWFHGLGIWLISFVY